MIYAIGAILFMLLIYAPHLWVKYILWKHSDEIADMPGTGGELAQHFVERFELADVKIVQGEEGQDYYDPHEKIVSLSPNIYQGKSLTAIAVATHEIGHAIQFSQDEPVTQLRSKYMTINGGSTAMSHRSA